MFLGWSPIWQRRHSEHGTGSVQRVPADYGGKATKGLPVLAGVQNLRDVTYAVSLVRGIPASKPGTSSAKTNTSSNWAAGVLASSRQASIHCYAAGRSTV